MYRYVADVDADPFIRCEQSQIRELVRAAKLPEYGGIAGWGEFAGRKVQRFRVRDHETTFR